MRRWTNYMRVLRETKQVIFLPEWLEKLIVILVWGAFLLAVTEPLWRGLVRR